MIIREIYRKFCGELIPLLVEVMIYRLFYGILHVVRSQQFLNLFVEVTIYGLFCEILHVVQVQSNQFLNLFS